VYGRDSDGARLVISIHPGDIPTGTLRGIIEEMGITVEEFRGLL
jgi:predicted RNA binding protein YcfA (HicA-like mRNA interferase family)